MLKILIQPSNKKNRVQIKKLVQISLDYLDLKNVSLSIIFLSSEEMSIYNNKYKKSNFSTDVLSFPSEIDNDLGDIFICEENILNNASLYNESFISELKRVIIHGILHLIGYNDKNKFEKDKMWNIQEKILDIKEVKEIK